MNRVILFLLMAFIPASAACSSGSRGSSAPTVPTAPTTPTATPPLRPEPIAPKPPPMLGAWACTRAELGGNIQPIQCQYSFLADGHMQFELINDRGQSLGSYASYTYTEDASPLDGGLRRGTIRFVDPLGRESSIRLEQLGPDHIRLTDVSPPSVLELSRIDPGELWPYVAKDQR